eukprot:232203-Amphidinium_carterae.1
MCMLSMIGDTEETRGEQPNAQTCSRAAPSKLRKPRQQGLQDHLAKDAPKQSPPEARVATPQRAVSTEVRRLRTKCSPPWASGSARISRMARSLSS